MMEKTTNRFLRRGIVGFLAVKLGVGVDTSIYNPINAREKYNKENSHVVFAFDNIASVPPCTRILLTSARSGERGEPVSWPR